MLEIAATPSKELLAGPGLGLGIILHWLPFQCIANVIEGPVAIQQ
jgi:hypothetical protein